MVWGDGGAYATWFSAEPEMIQGINMLPITGGHLYLGDNPAYVRTNYNELVTNNGGAPTVWQDIIWEFLALGDRDAALANFRANPGFTSEEGESQGAHLPLDPQPRRAGQRGHRQSPPTTRWPRCSSRTARAPTSRPTSPQRRSR